MQTAVRFAPSVPDLVMPEKEELLSDGFGIYNYTPNNGEIYADSTQSGFRLWVDNYSQGYGGYATIDQTDNVYVIRDEFIPDNTGDPVAYARGILEQAADGEFDAPNAAPTAPGRGLTDVGRAIVMSRKGVNAELYTLSMADALAALLGGAGNAGMHTMSRIARQLNSGDTTPLLSMRRVCGEDSVPPRFYLSLEGGGFRGTPQHVCCGCNPNEIREFAARGFLVSGVSWYGRDEDGWTARLDLECDQEGRVVHLYYTCKDEEGNLVLSLDAPDQEAFRKRAWGALARH